MPSPLTFGSNVSMWAAPPPSQRKMQASAFPLGVVSAAGESAPPIAAAPVFRTFRRVICIVFLLVPVNSSAFNGQHRPGSRNRLPPWTRAQVLHSSSWNHHEFGRIDHGPQGIFKALAEFRRQALGRLITHAEPPLFFHPNQGSLGAQVI